MCLCLLLLFLKRSKLILSKVFFVVSSLLLSYSIFFVFFASIKQVVLRINYTSALLLFLIVLYLSWFVFLVLQPKKWLIEITSALWWVCWENWGWVQKSITIISMCVWKNGSRLVHSNQMKWPWSVACCCHFRFLPVSSFLFPWSWFPFVLLFGLCWFGPVVCSQSISALLLYFAPLSCLFASFFTTKANLLQKSETLPPALRTMCVWAEKISGGEDRFLPFFFLLFQFLVSSLDFFCYVFCSFLSCVLFSFWQDSMIPLNRSVCWSPPFCRHGDLDERSRASQESDLGCAGSMDGTRSLRNLWSK